MLVVSSVTPYPAKEERNRRKASGMIFRPSSFHHHSKPLYCGSTVIALKVNGLCGIVLEGHSKKINLIECTVVEKDLFLRKRGSGGWWWWWLAMITLSL